MQEKSTVQFSTSDHQSIFTSLLSVYGRVKDIYNVQDM